MFDLSSLLAIPFFAAKVWKGRSNNSTGRSYGRKIRKDIHHMICSANLSYIALTTEQNRLGGVVIGDNAHRLIY